MLTTIRHLMWHDARALRVPLAVWAGVLALQLAVVAVGPQFAGSIDDRADVNAGPAALVMRFAMTVILTALLIQRDTAVGTTAFWLTRPIRPVAMWTAKLVAAVFLCVLVPALLTWALFVGLGLSATGAREAAWPLLREQTVVVAFAVMSASVTATLAHFVVANLAGYAAWWFLMPAAAGWRHSLPHITLPGVYSILYAWIGAVVAGAIVVSAHQYSTRRRARSWALVVIWLLLAMGALVLIRNTPAPDPATASGRAFTPPADVEVGIVDGSVADEPVTLLGSTGRPAPGRALSASIWVTSPSETIAYEPVAVASSVATTTGNLPTVIRWSESVRRRTWSISQWATVADQPYRSMRAALAVNTVVLAPSPSTPRFQAYLAEWPIDACRAFAAKGGGVLRAQVVVRAYRYVVAGTMPLRAGSSYARDDRRMSIASVVRTARGVVVTVRTAFRSAFDDNVGRQGAVHYVLRNRARQEAVFFTDQQASNAWLTAEIGGPSPGTGLRRFEFDSQRPTQGRVAFTNAWLDGAELVVLAAEDLGTFTRSAEVWVQMTGVAK